MVFFFYFYFLVSSLYRFIQHKTTSYNFIEVADHIHDQIRL